MSEQFDPKGGYRYREGPKNPSPPWDRDDGLKLTSEEQKEAEKLYNQVCEAIKEGFVRTPEKVKAAREAMLSHMDEVEQHRLEAVKESGHTLGKTKLLVEYNFDTELGVWEFRTLRLQEELKFNDKVKFVQLEEKSKLPGPHPPDCGCFNCDLKRAKDKK